MQIIRSGERVLKLRDATNVIIHGTTADLDEHRNVVCFRQAMSQS